MINNKQIYVINGIRQMSGNNKKTEKLAMPCRLIILESWENTLYFEYNYIIYIYIYINI